MQLPPLMRCGADGLEKLGEERIAGSELFGYDLADKMGVNELQASARQN
jgi:hypothetical protein